MGSPIIPAKEKLTLVSNLGTMLTAGIPILEAVETLLTDSKGGMRKLLLLFRDALTEGKPLSKAMEKAPKVFDPVTINLLRAAEEAGTLEEAFDDLSHSLKKDMAFSSQVRASFTYPVFVFVIFVGVLILMLTFVIPRVASVFAGMRVKLPAITELLINTSNIFRDNVFLILLGIAALIALIVVIYQTQKRALLNALLQLPGLRRLGKNIDLTRFTRSMSLLLHAGIPVAEALTLSTQVVTKQEVIKLIEQMRTSVDSGKPMSDGLQKIKKIVPPMMVRLLQTAERSGTLEKTMQELSEHFEAEVSRTLKTITTLIEPVMIATIGLLVGGMMLAIMAPIYNLISQVQAR